MKQIYAIAVVFLFLTESVLTSQNTPEQKLFRYARRLERNMFNIIVSERKIFIAQYINELKQDPLWLIHRWMQQQFSLERNYRASLRRLWLDFRMKSEQELLAADCDHEKVVTDPELLQQYADLDTLMVFVALPGDTTLNARALRNLHLRVNDL